MCVCHSNNRNCEWAKGLGREWKGRVCCDLSKIIPARQHRSSSAAALGNCFATPTRLPAPLRRPCLPALRSSCVGPHFFPRHTRHKSMFDFYNNNNSSSRREIRKAMRKKKQNERSAKSRDTEAKRARTRDTSHGTRETGRRTQDIMFAPCLKFLPLVCVIFILYTFFAFSCAAFHLMRYTFFVVSLRQMKCIKFRDMRGARGGGRAQRAGRNGTLRVCGQNGR